MEANKRERVILFGVVPIVAAVIGAVVTVIATRYFGSSGSIETLTAIATDHAMSAADKVRAIDLVNKNQQQFYDFLRNVLVLLLVPIAAVGWAIARWIDRR